MTKQDQLKFDELQYNLDKQKKINYQYYNEIEDYSNKIENLKNKLEDRLYWIIILGSISLCFFIGMIVVQSIGNQNLENTQNTIDSLNVEIQHLQISNQNLNEENIYLENTLAQIAKADYIKRFYGISYELDYSVIFNENIWYSSTYDKFFLEDSTKVIEIEDYNFILQNLEPHALGYEVSVKQ